jgi:hypothetical protein
MELIIGNKLFQLIIKPQKDAKVAAEILISLYLAKKQPTPGTINFLYPFGLWMLNRTEIGCISKTIKAASILLFKEFVIHSL